MKRFVPVAQLLLVFSVSAPAWGAPGRAAVAPAQINVIQMEGTMCLGRCPAYKVTLYRSGKAFYFGAAYAPRWGLHRGRVPLRVFSKLSKLIEKAGFFGLYPSYRVRYTCQSSRILRVRVGRRWVEVLEYGAAGPSSLHGLQQAVDSVAHQIIWRKPGVPVLASQTPGVFLRDVLSKLADVRKSARLPALKPDLDAGIWASIAAGRLTKPYPRGTILRERTGAIRARVVSCGHEYAREAVLAMTKGQRNPLVRSAYRRLGLGATWDSKRGTWCVVAVVGK